MSGMDCLTDATLERIGSVCHLLEKLDVSFSGEEGKLTDAGLRNLLKLSPTLVHLVFSGIDGVSMVTEAELEYTFNINQFWIEAPLP